MTCLTIGLCVLVALLDLPDPEPVAVHVVKTETISVQPQPVYPCGEIR
jgi:hypothetical protein